MNFYAKCKKYIFVEEGLFPEFPSLFFLSSFLFLIFFSLFSSPFSLFVSFLLYLCLNWPHYIDIYIYIYIYIYI